MSGFNVDKWTEVTVEGEHIMEQKEEERYLGI